LRSANKKAIENLILAGGLDCFTNTNRAQYFQTEQEGIPFYEKAIRYGSKFQENQNSSQASLFGESTDVQISEPTIPKCEEWSTMEKLAKEKEVVGIYISGHPLDDYRFEMRFFCNNKLESLKNLEKILGKNIAFGGIVSNVQHRIAKNGKGWATFQLEGYDENHEFRIFNEEYLKYRHYLVVNQFIYIKIFVKDGWINKETGKKSEPNINFVQVELLQDILAILAKKLILQLEIQEIQENLITKLIDVFKKNSGNSPVSFDIVEFDTNITMLEPTTTLIADQELMVNEEGEVIETNTMLDNVVEFEKNPIKNKVDMNSRSLKVNISQELLQELEKIQINFKLN
jgi:DNA polymerase-3 subunit alpha